jgi:hypothetical protein
MHGRSDHHGKGRFITQEPDRWQRRSQVVDSPCVLSSHFESSNVYRQDHSFAEATEKSGLFHQGKDDGVSVPPHPDPGDSQTHVIYSSFIFIIPLLSISIFTCCSF